MANFLGNTYTVQAEYIPQNANKVSRSSCTIGCTDIVTAADIATLSVTTQYDTMAGIWSPAVPKTHSDWNIYSVTRKESTEDAIGLEDPNAQITVLVTGIAALYIPIPDIVKNGTANFKAVVVPSNATNQSITASVRYRKQGDTGAFTNGTIDANGNILTTDSTKLGTYDSVTGTITNTNATADNYELIMRLTTVDGGYNLDTSTLTFYNTTNIPVTSLSWTLSPDTVPFGLSETFTAVAYPINATDRSVTYSLDQAAISAGITINSTSGVVTNNNNTAETVNAVVTAQSSNPSKAEHFTTSCPANAS